MHEQNLACPNCNHNILFDVNALLQGVSFSCSNCDAKIQLSSEPRNTVGHSMNEFNKIKQKTLKQ